MGGVSRRLPYGNARGEDKSVTPFVPGPSVAEPTVVQVEDRGRDL